MSVSENSKSLDILGIKPVGESIKIATEATVRQAEQFLSLICQPASKEFGLLLRDQVKAWRQANLVKIANKAQEKAKQQNGEKELHACPKVVSLACESGSWVEHEHIQEMWAGLIASACTEDGEDDSNLVFVQLLGQLTTNQARLIKFLCENSKLFQDDTQWVYAEMGDWNSRELTQAGVYTDANRFRTEASHLRQLGLIDIFFDSEDPQVTKCGPTVLALDLYVRTQGSRQPIHQYFKGFKPLTDEDDVVTFPNNVARLG